MTEVEAKDMLAAAQEQENFWTECVDSWLPNSEMLKSLVNGLMSLDAEWAILSKYPKVMGNVPSQMPVIQHNVVLTKAMRPICQHPYCLSLSKRELIKAETDYLVQSGMATPSMSPWISPCLLVP